MNETRQVVKSVIPAHGMDLFRMVRYETKVPGFVIRSVDEGDVDLILSFIMKLAEYEGLLPEVSATKADIYDSIIAKRQAEVIIGELDGSPVAFALFFHNYSTFLGKANLYLEDLYVNEEQRGKGIGRTMFACLAKIAVERNCGRLDWWCLDSNETSIAFYRRMGARPMSDWTVYRIDGETLNDLARSL
ncbi:MAG: Acetyltransferase (GNAT) family protein [Methanomassiliicoccales archaeon PtaU1.Bin124]|nr:MAG: Acetyltransferase (GNAT) family protein [Methanomassiliicoccales archaeon PtaU1.Bin124]